MEHKTRICVGCGKEFELTRPNKIFCCRVCAKRFNARAHKAKDKLKRTEKLICPHNEGVACTNKECDSCGWNPSVAKQRKEAMRYEVV